jgi:hypothetical protein
MMTPEVLELHFRQTLELATFRETLELAQSAIAKAAMTSRRVVPPKRFQRQLDQEGARGKEPDSDV